MNNREQPDGRAGARRFDAWLMRRIADGDADALALLYDRQCAAAFRVAVHVVGDRPTAEDVCQVAFLDAWRSAANYDAARGSARAWLLGIVTNRAIDAVRHRRVQPSCVADPEVLAAEPADERTEELAVRNLRAAAVRETLATLPEEQRQAIVLAYFGGLTHTEIADALGQPLGTVKGRIRLGLQKLHHHAFAIAPSRMS